MILVTGGTGFIGRALVRHLAEAGQEVRLLIRPSKQSPKLPTGTPVQVAVSSLEDERGLRAAMAGADTLYHLIGGEWKGPRASLMDIDIQGTQAILRAAKESRIDRIFFVSHLGADRASAYPVLKAKAIAEEHIRRSGIDYTILRSASVYGPNDGFTTGLAKIIRAIPFIFFMPGDGSTLLQPLWVEDLAACLTWSLDDPATRNQTYEVGGPEALSFKNIVQIVMDALGTRRMLVPVRPPHLRTATVTLDHIYPRLPISVYWLDYLAINHTCALDSLPHNFNIAPARISQRLDYLRGLKRQPPLLGNRLARRHL